jgi:hypothetical protein
MTHSTENILHLLPESKHVCQVVPRLFSKADCEALLTEAVKSSFRQAHDHYPTSYRNNDRLVVDSDVLAQKLFELVRPFLPESIAIESENRVEAGTWQLRELNSRFRFCRYSAGQYFHRHLDGVHYRSDRVQSKLTFMLYLNGAEEFEGGRTLFYRSKDAEEVWAAYLPRQGDLIFFDHNLWHEGEELRSGEKYVLRSDILYEKTDSETAPLTQHRKPYQEGHLGYIWKLLLFDDRLLISGGRNKLIKVWDREGSCVQHLKGHQHSILCMAQANESTFLSGSRDQLIKVWQWEEGQFIFLREFHFHHAAVLSLCRLSDDWLVSSGGDNRICLFTLAGEVVRTLCGHLDWVWSIIALSESRLASASEDGTIRIWDYRTGICLTTFAEGAPVHCLAFDAPTGRLTSGNGNGEITIRRWEPTGDNWVVEQTFIAHRGIVRTLLLSNGHYLASGGEDNQVRIWDLGTRVCLKTYPHANFVQSLVIHQNQLISASYDGQIRTWELLVAD